MISAPCDRWCPDQASSGRRGDRRARGSTAPDVMNLTVDAVPPPGPKWRKPPGAQGRDRISRYDLASREPAAPNAAATCFLSGTVRRERRRSPVVNKRPL